MSFAEQIIAIWLLILRTTDMTPFNSFFSLVEFHLQKIRIFLIFLPPPSTNAFYSSAFALKNWNVFCIEMSGLPAFMLHDPLMKAGMILPSLSSTT